MMQTRRLTAALVGLGAAMVIPLLATPAHAQREIATLLASDGTSDDQFGQSVAMHGDYMIAGADKEDTGSTDSGAAYIYHLESSVWVQQQKIKPGDLGSLDRFGASVAISEEVAVIGAPQQGPSSRGAVYVYRRSGSSWAYETTFYGTAGQRLGDAVAIDSDGDRIVMGGTQLSSGPGVAVISDYSGTWSIPTALDNSGLGLTTNAFFGGSVAIDGDLVVVGARQRDVGLIANCGAAYVYHFDGASWNLEFTLEADGADQQANDNFGCAVSISGEVVAIGAFGDDEFGSNAGAAYVFSREPDDSWIATHKLVSAWYFAGDNLGNSVSLDGTRLVAGAPGAEYAAVWQYDGFDWYEDPGSPVTASLGGAFGTSIALAGETFVVGIPGNNAVQGAVSVCFVNRDTDGDGLGDYQEMAEVGTDPDDADTDDDGLNDGGEVSLMTDPFNPDTDGDALTDGLEIAFTTNPLVPDTDGDGLGDGAEVTLAGGSGCPNPAVADSDGDGFSDGAETSTGWDPCDADTDGDGLEDGDEQNTHNTDPLDNDSDDDGMLDGAEVAAAAGSGCPDPNNADSDGDGIEDGNELMLGMGPCDTDSDNDGLADNLEASFGTSPTDSDSDNDGVLDGAEVDTAMGSGCPSPTNPDSDADGLNDGAEATASTSPCNPDTDGDGLLDGVDPAPTTPSITPAILASLTLATAGEIADTSTSEFMGPNLVAKKARRATLASLTALASVAIHRGQYAAARALLTTVEKVVDGISPPPDWMVPGSAKSDIHDDIESLLVLLDLID